MNINRFIRWFIDNFFVFLLAAYSLLCAYWYIVSPKGAPIVLLIFSAVFYILWSVFSKHNVLRRIFSTITILFLVLTGYLLSFTPKLEQMVSYNGYTYFLTYNREFLGNGMSFPRLAKWDNKFHHSVSGLGGTCCNLRLTYDPLLHVVSVVEIAGDTQTLAFAIPTLGDFTNKILSLEITVIIHLGIVMHRRRFCTLLVMSSHTLYFAVLWKIQAVCNYHFSIQTNMFLK